MIIDAFNNAWFIMFGVLLLVLVTLILLCKGKSNNFKLKFMIYYYIFLVVFYIVYKWYLIIPVSPYETTIWEELPFGLCHVTAFLGLPAILSKNRTLLGFSFFVGTCCSLMAIVMPTVGFADIPLLSGESIGYYGFHMLLIIQSLLIYINEFYNPEVKDAPKIAGFLGLAALIAHGINYLLRSTVGVETNHFFTYNPMGNPVLELLRKYIDINYVYLLPLLIPIALLLVLLSLVLHKKNL